METVTLQRKIATNNTSNNGFQAATYASLQAQKAQLLLQGKLQKAPETDDIFTSEQEVEFNRGMTIDRIFEKYAFK